MFKTITNENSVEYLELVFSNSLTITEFSKQTKTQKVFELRKSKIFEIFKYRLTTL